MHFFKNLTLGIMTLLMGCSKDPSFEPINKLLIQEGKFVNHIYDSGGATNYGISLRLLKSMGVDIDFDGNIDIDDILALDESIARTIYKSEWWDRYGYGRIKDPQIATILLSLSVNMGAKQAHKIIQKSINETFNTNIKVDGILSDDEFFYLNHYPNRIIEFKIHLRKNALLFYRSLILKNKNLNVFIKGWENRVNKIIQG